MVVSTSTVADVANNALTRLGYRLRVGSLLDGSNQSQVILQVYGQTRDELLRNFDYDFAERTIALTVLKSAPSGGYFPPNTWDPTTMPPVGFGFEYAFPDDCVKIRNLVPQPSFVVNMNPQPIDWTEFNDNRYTPARRTILTNVADAIATYTGRVTDPTNWDVAFAEALSAALARRIGPSLVSLEAAKAEGADEQVSVVQSQMEGR